MQQDMSDVPDSDPIKAIFGGMDEDTTQRLVTAVTDKDKDAMRVRWVRQRVHAELEAVHEETMHATVDCVIDLDIEGSLLDNAKPQLSTMRTAFRSCYPLNKRPNKWLKCI